jgi:ribose transport system permease protein
MNRPSTGATTAKAPAGRNGAQSLLRRLGAVDEIGVIGAIVLLSVVLAILVGDTFLSANNFVNVSRQASYVGIMAVGMVFVIAMGDIDLSVGSIWMLSSVSMAIALREELPIWLAVIICMVVATLCGLTNGLLSVWLRIPTIIVTLGTLSLFRGLGLVISNATPVSGYNLETWFFEWIGGRDPIFGVWTSVWVMILVGVGGWLLFTRSAFGRRVQAIGSNLQAARFSGVRIARYRIMVMALMGFIRWDRRRWSLWHSTATAAQPSAWAPSSTSSPRRSSVAPPSLAAPARSSARSLAPSSSS